ncbi:hypothetical protein B7G68_15160 [Caulobacter segnis]|uniref:Lipoprotein n=2 Tax=Caulobacter segnis TaxID=88688 RepID=D5VLN0_CAUST|nr:hypothetical protein [Caulobacter segnis]ADG11403.1 conserved hypothetical protein [Caulobacter segnis ATCC 21756]AVQ03070.1 hypothetical protein B7G68_15160 [Caulobacter segnis]
MKRAIFLAGVALACLSLSACSSFDAALQPGGVGEKVLTNLEGCHREYSGAIGAGVTGSFRIICDPAPSSEAGVKPATPPGGT